MEQANAGAGCIVKKSQQQMKFEALYGQVAGDLYKVAFYTLRSGYDAEDAVSETVVDAFSSFHSLRDERKFRAWIFKILSAKCKRKFKEYARHPLPLDHAMMHIGIQQVESGTELQAAFRKLSEEERLIVSMSVFGGYASHEIGKMLHLNANTVRSKHSRALQKMREDLK